MNDRPTRPTKSPEPPELSEDEREIRMVMSIQARIADALIPIAYDSGLVSRALRSVALLHGIDLVPPGEGPMEHR